ncbi:DUF1844 domain-containing protein [Rubripirellula amarantea]|uniref:DUF1844 domain-containing protein n=1 Tax=Rubripirellula amarantea TaxID=2527999 RepID=A0A5C5WQR5_9BACT|nr:DUF1844 domain-containing protein [Rubripirellula amarantea]MDA8744163.1 DUF1844 domain-containing protein [Rubripirellula amarantea]TWT53234.1 hypothetical protein Pla22_08620 [Rubripirellula amarantea]
MSESKDEPKIIVDDDWKAQVEKEKAAAASEAEATESEATNTEAAELESTSHQVADDSTDVTSSGSSSDAMPAPPPASFEVMISMMFTQAMAMLGQIPDPTTGKASVNKPYAKHYIDTLEMLGEKTKGNLSDDESKMLSEAMHALRMAYVSVKAS